MRRHAYDWVALSFGALFVVIVGNWAAHTQGLISTTDLALLAPIALIVVGVLGIIASLTSAARSKGPLSPNEAQETVAQETEPTTEIDREQGSTP